MEQNQQPEALALASILEIRVKMFGEQQDNPPAWRAAKELRRLHARVEELEAVLDAVGAGGVSAQRITQAADHIAQDRKVVAAQEPFGYFKAEPFGWRDCAETEEGAVALYEAPQPQAVPEGWKLVPERPTQNMCEAAKYGIDARLSVFKWADAYKVMCNNAPTPPKLASEPQPLPSARDAERYRFLRSRDLETVNNGGVFAGVTPDNIVLNGTDLDAEIDAAIAAAKGI